MKRNDIYNNFSNRNQIFNNYTNWNDNCLNFRNWNIRFDFLRYISSSVCTYTVKEHKICFFSWANIMFNGQLEN